MTTAQQYIVTITEKSVGRRKPVQRFYNVCATSNEDARAAIMEELGEHQLEGATVTISACQCRVMRAA